ncbi:HAD family hydrolase [Jeotgalibacillus soli]|uniref:Haloacid dehalogenase n=1 Tax=Jeotgalibacillus soli TaxID=889306 RepID=A0A0C2QX63_9BACL|nr:HAD family hydrolase [Jeotgalibacillus soli]KIL42675.1 hypothetical protein KP78_38980 [Jeotgalibacillus soli]
MEKRKIIIDGEVVSASVIAFDKDGTLFQAEPFWLALNDERKKHFMAIAGEEYGHEWDHMMGVNGNKVDHHGLLAIAGEQEEQIAIAALLYKSTKIPWIACVTQAKKLLNKSNQELDIQSSFQPYDDAVALMRSLKQAGYVVGIVTSDQHARTIECLKLIGMEKEMDFVVTPADVQNGKPAPDMLKKVCRNFTIPSEELLVIGDSIVDSLMARAAGCKSVAVHSHESMRQALLDSSNYVIERLSEISVKWE